MRAPDDRFIAGKLAIKRKPRSREPDERMEPQSAQRNLVEQANEIIAPPCVGEFVQQDSLELPLIEQAIDAQRKQNMWGEHAADRRCGMSRVEVHRDSLRDKTRRQPLAACCDRSSGLALPAYAPDQSYEHGQGAGHPYQRTH